MLPTLHIYLLGDFRLVYRNQLVTSLSSPRLQSLLAYLVLHRTAPQSRQHLAFLLWPDSTEAQARTNLRYLLHQLRQALPASKRFLLTDVQTVQWRSNAPFTLDVDAFVGALTRATAVASLREAVDLYTGDLLPSLYDDWSLPERARLRQLYVGALEKLTSLLEDQGDYHSAIKYTQLLLRHDSLREETYRQLMRLYALSGDPTGVLRVYQTCVTVLKRELDAEVSHATREAYHQLLKIETPPERPTELPPQPRHHNLPIQLTSFIGREPEIAEVKRLLMAEGGRTKDAEERPGDDIRPEPVSGVRAFRVLTLTGAGGCGKTRLALEVARELLDAFKDGAWLVDLAPVSDPALVPLAVALVLDVREQADRTRMETLADYLQTKELLLVLDNCEHLLNACAQLAEALLHVCPLIQILATSRERLNIAGETVWLVPALPVPAPELATKLAQLSRCESIRLFKERAAAALPTFVLNPLNGPVVAHVCRHLDGIPLAIELAAAHMKILAIEQIAERLEDRFRLLVGGSRTALPKHQTLRATMDWSYQLLSESERALFRCLSVFAGGFSLKAAEAIGGELEESKAPNSIHAADVLELLAQLVDKSLIVVDLAQQPNTEARFRMMETIRQYAHEKLLEASAYGPTRDRHLEFFMRLAEEAEPKLYGPEQMVWLNSLDVELDNLRVAMDWSMKGGNALSGLRLAGALWWFWNFRGFTNEGVDRLAALLSQPAAAERTTVRVKGLNAAAFLASSHNNEWARQLCTESLTISRGMGDHSNMALSLHILGTIHESLEGDYVTAGSLFEESLALYMGIGYQWGIATVLSVLGGVALALGDPELARSRYERSLAILRQLGDQMSVGRLLAQLGRLALVQHDYPAAQTLLEQSLAILRTFGTKLFIADVLAKLGNVARLQGNHAQAMALQTEGLSLQRGLGSKQDIAYSLDGFASLAVVQGNTVHAATLFAAARALYDASGARIPGALREEDDFNLAAVRAQLDDATFNKAWAEGSSMTVEQAINYALKPENLQLTAIVSSEYTEK